MLEFMGSLANFSICSEACLSSSSRPIIVSLLVRWITQRRDLMAATGRAAFSCELAVSVSVLVVVVVRFSVCVGLERYRLRSCMTRDSSDILN